MREGVHPLYQELIDEGVDNALITQVYIPLCTACTALFLAAMVVVHTSPAPYFTDKVEFGPLAAWTSMLTAVAFTTGACSTLGSIIFAKLPSERPVMWVAFTGSLKRTPTCRLVIQVVCMMYELIRDHIMHSRSTDVFVPFLCTNSVQLLTAIGHFVMTAREQLMCRDMLGGSIQFVRLLQWMLSFPLLGLLVHSIQPARARTSAVTAILTGTLTIVFAFFGIMVRGSLLGLRTLMTITVLLFCDQLRMLFRFYSVMKYETVCHWKDAAAVDEPNDTTLSNIVSSHMSKRLKLLYLRRFGLFSLIVCVSMVFALLYFSKWTFPLSDEYLACLYNVTEMFSKLLYASLSRASIADFLDPRPIFQLFLNHEIRLNEARKVFIRYIFHEIRVPFNTIALGIRDIKESAPHEHHGNSSDIVPVLDAMGESAEVISRTLDDVLSFSKMESNKGEVEMATFSIREVLERTITAARAAAAEASVKITTNIDETIPAKIIGDNHKIRQVMSNLVLNAIKFSFKSDEVEVSLANLGAQESGDSKIAMLRFSVRDQGPGISTQDQKSLFVPFSQIRPGVMKCARGSGLVLAICKDIVQKHGGTFGVTSSSARGATFFFEIPFVVDTAPAPDSPAQLSVINAQNQAILTGHRALVVDDVSSNRKLIANRLKRLGMHVEECANGEEAVQTVQNSERFTIIIMDNVMPVMNGLEATKAITAQRDDLFVVGLTGNALQEDVDLFIAAGARYVLSKPLDVPSLQKILLEAAAFTNQLTAK